jgi:hypothetical protein
MERKQRREGRKYEKNATKEGESEERKKGRKTE